MPALRFKTKESGMRTVAKKEKEIREAVAAAMPTGTEIMCFFEKSLFISY